MTTGTATVAYVVPSACAVAFTVYVPGSAGAEYSPAAVMAPPLLSVTDHATIMSDVPLTDAVNCRVAPVSSTPDGPLMTTLIEGTGALLEPPPPPPHPTRTMAVAHPMQTRMARRCRM